MTITSQTFRFLYAATAAASTLFPYTNKILDEDDLKVYVDTVLQTIGTDYFVTGVGLAAGGNVDFVAAPSDGSSVLITKDGVEFTQDTDYVKNDAFPASSHENALDKLTNQVQKIWDYVERSVKLAITSALTNLELPEPQAGTYLAWNSAETALENMALIEQGAISDEAYSSATWDEVSTIAPAKNALRDKFEAVQVVLGAKVSDTAYSSTTWNGVDTIAPSKNAIRDLIETIIPSGEKILFYKNTAVAGYSLLDTLDDKVVYVTKGSVAGGQTGGGVHSTGTWTISGITGGGHALSVAELAVHNHSYDQGGNDDTHGGSGTGGNETGSDTSGNAGSGSSHNHGASSHNGAWRPSAYCFTMQQRN